VGPRGGSATLKAQIKKEKKLIWQLGVAESPLRASLRWPKPLSWPLGVDRLLRNLFFFFKTLYLCKKKKEEEERRKTLFGPWGWPTTPYESDKIMNEHNFIVFGLVLLEI
jgi:hypothetical protein